MSSAVNIQIASMPNLAKIESFLKDVSYRETIEYSANFNTRLCIERRLRLPFLDPQTGVAQNHSQLFVHKRQRMPGFRQGQIYTYPATRWRKSRRQYLTKMYGFPERPFQALRKEHESLALTSGITISNASGLSGIISGTACGTVNSTSTGSTSASFIGSNNSNSSILSLNMLTEGGIPATTPTVLSTLNNDITHELNGVFSLEESCSLGAAGGDTSDSKDSQFQTQQNSKDELPKEWFYDEMDVNDVDSIEDPKSPADDEYDYDPRYGNKKRRKRRPSKRATGENLTSGNNSARRRTVSPRTRVTTTDASLSASLEAIDVGDQGGTPTPSSGRRSRGIGSRGRRRTKGIGNGGSGCGAATASTTMASGSGLSSNTCDPPSPGMVNEPPSFESAAAAVGVATGVSGVEDGQAHLRNYRKYL